MVLLGERKQQKLHFFENQALATILFKSASEKKEDLHN